MLQKEIKKFRTEYGITLAELAGWTGLPSRLIEQIEEGTAPALETDLERITSVLIRLIRERDKSFRP